MTTPSGLEQIIETFGNLESYIRPDGTLSVDWETYQLELVDLPFPIALSWATTVQVTKIRCHKLLVGTIHAVFQQIVNLGRMASVQTFGGCFSYRPQRQSTKLSTHAWGIALDLNPETNQQGTSGNMDQQVVQAFTDAGFVWGGTFAGNRQDPMHFQFASNY